MIIDRLRPQSNQKIGDPAEVIFEIDKDGLLAVLSLPEESVAVLAQKFKQAHFMFASIGPFAIKEN